VEAVTHWGCGRDRGGTKVKEMTCAILSLAFYLTNLRKNDLTHARGNAEKIYRWRHTAGIWQIRKKPAIF
jgi:hypothetical protein